jgi:hypothetical protein
MALARKALFSHWRDNMVAPALTTSRSDRWFTPPDLLADIEAFLGAGYLDPCPAMLPGQKIQSGLWMPWRGRVYVNPPYGRAIGPWIIKAMTDPVDELLILVPARTETGWFQSLYDWPVCFLRGRLKFSGVRDNAPFPSALVYRGERREAFYSAFTTRGVIVERAC